MEKLSYLAVLAGIALGTVWLEYALRTKVLRRLKRLALAIGPVLAVFLVWDAYAIEATHWTFAAKYVTGWQLGAIPLEEVLFFVLVPLAAVLTLEAVRSARGWAVGDEAQPETKAKQLP